MMRSILCLGFLLMPHGVLAQDWNETESPDFKALWDATKIVSSSLHHRVQYFGAWSSSRLQPVTSEELRSAFLSPEGINQIQQLFDKAIHEYIYVGLTVPVKKVSPDESLGPDVRSKVIIPEIGGMATLKDGKIRLQEIPDPTRNVMWNLAEHAGNMADVLRLFNSNSEIMKLISADSGNLLRRFLDTNLLYWQEHSDLRPKLPAMFQRLVLTTLENAADACHRVDNTWADHTFMQEWSGKLIGPWHMHMPFYSPEGWYEGFLTKDAQDDGYAPSDIDFEDAGRVGQSLTIRFVSNGFDAYDLSRVKPGVKSGKPADYSQVIKVSYRSENWRRHFLDVHDQIKRTLEHQGRL